MVRCFVAVDVEDSEIIDKVVRVQGEIARLARIKPVERENLHFTLKFLGEIPEEKVEAVRKALLNLKFKTFRVQLKGVGVFPDYRYIRVIWIGAGEGSRELISLQKVVDEILVKLNFKKETEYTPHLTIARVKGVLNREALVTRLREMQSLEFGEIVVNRVRLKKSRLTARGPVYTTLAEYPAREG